MVQNALLQQEWRVGDLHDRLMAYLRPHFAHTYKNVRDRMGRYVFRPWLKVVEHVIYKKSINVVSITDVESILIKAFFVLLYVMLKQ